MDDVPGMPGAERLEPALRRRAPHEPVMGDIVEELQDKDGGDALHELEGDTPPSEEHRDCRINPKRKRQVSMDAVASDRPWIPPCAPALVAPSLHELSRSRTKDEAIGVLALPCGGRVFAGGGPAVMTMEVRDAEVHVGYAGQHRETEDALTTVSAMDHLVGGEHPENPCRRPCRYG